MRGKQKYSNLLIYFFILSLLSVGVSGDDNQTNLYNSSVLILHHNNNSAIGENNTHLVDSKAGIGNCTPIVELGFEEGIYLNKSIKATGANIAMTCFNTDVKFESGSQDFSISIWFNTSIPGTSNWIIWNQDGDNDGWGLRIVNGALWLQLDSKDVKSTTLVNDGERTHGVVVIDRDGNGQIYLNSVADGPAVGIASEAMDITRTVFDYLDTSTFEMIGGFDELLIFNRTITQGEIDWLYNSGTGRELTEPVIGDSSSIDLLFSNTTNPTIHKVLFDSGENFLIEVNWTDDATGNAINDSVGFCNISIFDGLVEHESSNDNFTICGTLCDFETYTEEFNLSPTLNAVMDIGHASVCNEQLQQQDAIVNISCGNKTFSETRDGSTIPLCDDGFAFVQINTSLCIAEPVINLTVTYSGGFVRRKRIIGLAIDRQYSEDVNSFPTDVRFNESTQTWVTIHGHKYYDSGLKNISAVCVNNASSDFNNQINESITIGNAPPEIFFSEVTNSGGMFFLSDNVILNNFTGLWLWDIAVVDLNLDFVQYNFTNSSGDVLQTNSSTGVGLEIQTPNGFFNDFANPYFLIVFANDTDGNSTTATLTFNVKADSNVSDLLITRGDCNVGEVINLTVSFLCAIGQINCTGNYAIGIDSCSLESGDLNGSYNLMYNNSFNTTIEIVCSTVKVYNYSLNVSNTDDPLQTTSIQLSCVAGGLTSEESSCLLTGRFINGTLCGRGGEQEMIGFLSLVFAAAIVFLIIGVISKQSVFLAVFGVLLAIDGYILIRTGITSVDNFLTNGVGVVFIVVGAFVMIVSFLHFKAGN